MKNNYENKNAKHSSSWGNGPVGIFNDISILFQQRAKSRNRDQRMQQDSALEVIKNNSLTKRFYENLQQGEIIDGNKWFSSEAHATPRSDLTGGANLFVINLNDGKNEA